MAMHSFLNLSGLCAQTQIVTTASPLFCALTIFGSLCMLASVYLWSLHPTDFTCNAHIWFLNVGVSAMFSSLVIKT